jgi:hypothetical protein
MGTWIIVVILALFSALIIIFLCIIYPRQEKALMASIKNAIEARKNIIDLLLRNVEDESYYLKYFGDRISEMKECQKDIRECLENWEQFDISEIVILENKIFEKFYNVTLRFDEEQMMFPFKKDVLLSEFLDWKTKVRRKLFFLALNWLDSGIKATEDFQNCATAYLATELKCFELAKKYKNKKVMEESKERAERFLHAMNLRDFFREFVPKFGFGHTYEDDLD